MTEATNKTAGTKKSANPKVGYAIAIVLGLLIVLLIAFYFIYNGLNHAGRWVQVYSSSIEADYFEDYEFAVLHDEEEVGELLRYTESAIDRYLINIEKYDYLLVGFIQECTNSSHSINQARVNDITTDGVAKIYIGYGASLFSSGDCYESTRYILFEGEKGSFDSIKKLEFSGAKRLDIGSEPEVDYITEATFIGIADEYEYNSKSKIFTDYDGMLTFISEIAGSIDIPVTAADFISHDYLYIPVSDFGCSDDIIKVGLTSIDRYVANVTIERRDICGVCAPSVEMYIIPVKKGSVSQISTKYETVGHERCNDYEVKKPVIYLYPEEETNVSVKLGAPEKLIVSYPLYADGWNVTAQPNGDLRDLKTGRELYSLYYEAKNTTSHDVRDTGFVVKGADTASFLEEKLAQLGLTDHEAEEFIIYWLPQMQGNAYNYIYFATGDEVAQNMPLEVSPAPKTTIRINMEWKALDAPITVKPQTLPATPIRDGFTLVEWGGTIL